MAIQPLVLHPSTFRRILLSIWEAMQGVPKRGVVAAYSGKMPVSFWELSKCVVHSNQECINNCHFAKKPWWMIVEARGQKYGCIYGNPIPHALKHHCWSPSNYFVFYECLRWCWCFLIFWWTRVFWTLVLSFAPFSSGCDIHEVWRLNSFYNIASHK